MTDNNVNIISKIKRKADAENGESISEVLVAMLVVALGSILLVTMVMAAEKMITSSKTSYQNLMENLNSMENRDATSTNVTVSIKSESTSIGTGTIGENISVDAKETVTMYTAPIPVKNSWNSELDRYYLYDSEETQQSADEGENQYTASGTDETEISDGAGSEGTE